MDLEYLACSQTLVYCLAVSGALGLTASSGNMHVHLQFQPIKFMHCTYGFQFDGPKQLILQVAWVLPWIGHDLPVLFTLFLESLGLSPPYMAITSPGPCRMG